MPTLSSQEELLAVLASARPASEEALVSVLDRHLPAAFQLEFLREVLFRAADPICITSLEGQIFFVNAAFCTLLAIPMEALVGRWVGDIDGVDPDRLQAIRERLDQGASVTDYEFILRRRDGQTRVLSISLTPLRAPRGGGYAATLNVVRDLTARRELERQVVEWQSRARQYLYAIHPPEIAEAMVEGRVEARNLSASVLFSDVTGFTSYSACVPPSEAAAALHRYFTEMTQVVLEHHGWVDKFIGDSLMALFGVPSGAADHARQATRAAAAMARRMRALGLPWRHKLGIASGEVIAGDIGSRQKPTYTALGDPVNLASRLTGLARPDEVLVCPVTHAASGPDFTYEDLGELDVRGCGKCRVYRLLPEGPRLVRGGRDE